MVVIGAAVPCSLWQLHNNAFDLIVLVLAPTPGLLSLIGLFFVPTFHSLLLVGPSFAPTSSLFYFKSFHQCRLVVCIVILV